MRAGGPKAAAAHAERALLLSWPDYDGQGTYGLACLEAYAGDTLLLVGEWRGWALTSTHGKAFSAAFQAKVERGFEPVEQIRLPSWPLVVDALVVWRRRPPVGAC